MLIGVIRSTETTNLTITGDDVEELRAQLAAQVPVGWVVTDSPVTKTKQVPSLTMAARLAHWGDLAEVECESVEAVRAAMPDGYQLILVRRVD